MENKKDTIERTEISTSKVSTKKKRDTIDMRKMLPNDREKWEKNMEQTKLEVALFNDKLEMYQILHPPVVQRLDWEALQVAPHPFAGAETGANEALALAQLKSYEASFFDKLFKRVKEKEELLLAKVEKARERDKKAIVSWEWHKKLADNILAGDTNAYTEALEKKLIVDDLKNLGIHLRHQVLHKDTLIFRAKKQSSSIYSENALAAEKRVIKKMYQLAHQDYLCSIALRLGQEGFNLLPIENIYVHIQDIPETTVLSVKFTRAAFQKIDFDNCDCSETVETFQHNMEFCTIRGMQQVEELEHV